MEIEETKEVSSEKATVFVGRPPEAWDGKEQAKEEYTT